MIDSLKPTPSGLPASVRPRRHRGGSTRRLLLIALAAVTVSLPGCGDTFVDPFLRETGPLSVYGAILADGTPATHRLRVQVIRTLPDPPTEPDDPAAEVAVEVTTEVEGTNQTFRWEPSQLRLPDGTLGTLFESTFRAWPGQTHHIRVSRVPDGEAATITLQIPPTPTGTLQPATGVVQEIVWNADNVVGGEVQYYIPGDRGPIPIRVPIEPQYGSVQTIDYARDFERVREILRTFEPVERDSIVLLRARSRPFAANEVSWPILPEDDSEAAQGGFSNVMNGRGLVTAATRGTLDFFPDREAARAAGFAIGY